MAANPNTTPSLSWQELVRREPRLAALERDVRMSDDGAVEFDGTQVWLLRFKRRLAGLVGWDIRSNDPVLTTHTAYDVAFHHLYDTVLPADRFIDEDDGNA